MTHLISVAGELQIPGSTLEGVAQHFIDVEREREGERPYDWNAFPNSLWHLFGVKQQYHSLDRVTGGDVRYWITRFLVHERVRSEREGQKLDHVRCVIALSCLVWAATGRPLPDDIVV